MSRTRSFQSIVFFLVLLLIQPGCATLRKGPTPEERAAFGTIGVSRASFLPKTEFDIPAKGRAEGAVKGAAIAFAGVMEGGMQSAHGISGEAAGFYILFLFALATAAMPVGAVVGAVRAMPGKEAVSNETLAMEILVRMRTQEVLRDEVVRVATEKTERPIVPVDGVGPASIDNVATYESLAERGIDTVLEVSLRRIALESDTWGSNPPLKFSMRAGGRLVRVSDGAVIDDHEYTTSSTSRAFTGWTADNGALLGREYEEGYRELAADIVRRIFPDTNPQKSE